jgi:hypothetical protein
VLAEAAGGQGECIREGNHRRLAQLFEVRVSSAEVAKTALITAENDGGLSLSGAVSTSMASFSSRRSPWARSRRRAIQPCAAGQQARGLVRRQVDS